MGKVVIVIVAGELQSLVKKSPSKRIFKMIVNVLATQTRQPPTRDNARTSYQNQNQNIKILLYYITTMSSTTPQLLSLDQED